MHIDAMENIPALLKAIKDAIDGNQTELAERLSTRKNKISQSQVSRWMNAKRPQQPEGHNYARILEVARELGLLAETAVNHKTDTRLLERPLADIAQRLEQRTDMADGVKVDIDQLDEDRARILNAAIAGRNAEVWQLTSDVLGADYQPGDFLIIDLAAHPKPRDLVLAESEQIPVFRMFVPSHLWAFSLSRQLPPIPVDGRRTVIKGVIIAKLSI